MNLTKLRNEQIRLIKYLEEGGYSKKHIRRIECEIKNVLKYGADYDSYLDYYENYIKVTYSSKNARRRK